MNESNETRPYTKTHIHAQRHSHLNMNNNGMIDESLVKVTNDTCYSKQTIYKILNVNWQELPRIALLFVRFIEINAIATISHYM